MGIVSVWGGTDCPLFSWLPLEASAVKTLKVQQREAGFQYLYRKTKSQLQEGKGRMGQLATRECSQIGGQAPVIAVFVRGLHILDSCKLFLSELPTHMS